MAELKKFSDAKLAERIVKYIDRLNSLLMQAEYYDGAPCPQAELDEILLLYSRVRRILREDAHYLGFEANLNTKSSVFTEAFRPSILEASAWGLSAPDGTPPGKELQKSLRTALERFTKYLSYDEWKFISLQ